MIGVIRPLIAGCLWDEILTDTVVYIGFMGLAQLVFPIDTVVTAIFDEIGSGLMKSEWYLFRYALFPQVATDFFKYRQAQQEQVDVTKADTANGAYPV